MGEKKKYRFETVGIHGGLQEDALSGARAVPIYQSNAYLRIQTMRPIYSGYQSLAIFIPGFTIRHRVSLRKGLQSLRVELARLLLRAVKQPSHCPF